jgi:hypothetical protein
MSNLPSHSFPYIVERVFSAVYVVHRIKLKNRILTEETRQSLIQMTVTLSKNGHKRLCIVFGTKDCIYIEPSGRIKASTQPPSGGFDIYNTYEKPPAIPNGLDSQL